MIDDGPVLFKLIQFKTREAEEDMGIPHTWKNFVFNVFHGRIIKQINEY